MQGYTKWKLKICPYGRASQEPSPSRGSGTRPFCCVADEEGDKADGSPGNILTQSTNTGEVNIQASDTYKDRVSIAFNASLIIANATLDDAKTFTCMVVAGGDVKEYAVDIEVHKRPLPPQVRDKVKEVEHGKLTMLGECVAQDAHPPAEVIWSKNGLPLVDDGKVWGLTKYLPLRDSTFAGQKETVVDSDTYTLVGVTRESTGEYKCSLVDDDNMQDAKNISVNYLDVSLDPSGKIVKTVGEKLLLMVQKNGSEEVKVSWTKDNGKLDKQPRFDNLTYSDAGYYVVDFSVAGINQSKVFQLVVQGHPQIKSISKARSEDGQHKVLTCEAEGSPEPSVQWSVNGTNEQSSYVNGKLTHKITVVPTANLTVTCTVSNELGEDVREIQVFSRK
ncbi:hypothetical protein JZ751_022789 [Albula glossodonta]|uniref:Ig-like domain-containing protein n=1 Tax=Albula glossodonta TaxID=121402 RepID=A0A8T2PMQ9_9TELE|nr:hypothetical protein JZ751_022789 [Albula glossodonta]